MRKPWTPEEEQTLRLYWGKTSTTEIGRMLDRSRHAVLRKIWRMGIEPVKPKKISTPNWSPGEIARLWHLVGTRTIPQVAKKIGRSEDAVRCKMYALGIPCRQGLITLVEGSKILGVDRKQIRKYLREVRDTRYKDGLYRKIEYHMTERDFSEVAQLMLDKGTIRNASAQTLMQVVRDYKD